MSGAAYLYDSFARLLEYPRAGTAARAEACAEALADHYEEAAREVRAFATFARGVAQHELEETYVRTFDLNPSATLDLGFQIFGESYKRGIFLVKMTMAARARRIDPGSELADHLPVVLRLLAHLEEADDPRSLVEEVILPATLKIAGTLNATPDAGAGAGVAPYASLLRAVLSILRIDFAVEKIRELPRLMDGPPGAADDGRRRLQMVDEL